MPAACSAVSVAVGFLGLATRLSDAVVISSSRATPAPSASTGVDVASVIDRIVEQLRRSSSDRPIGDHRDADSDNAFSWAAERLRDPSFAAEVLACSGEDEDGIPVAPPNCSADYVRAHDILADLAPQNSRLADSSMVGRCAVSVRHNHVCSGPAYDQWIDQHGPLFQNSSQAAKDTLAAWTDGGLLFLGNSHTSSVFEALLCDLVDEVDTFEAAKAFQYPQAATVIQPDHLTNAPLVSIRFGVDPSDGLYRGFQAFSNQLARVKLREGAHVYNAGNVRELYEGEAGLDSLLKRLGVAVADLRGVVLGTLNNQSWAEYVFPKVPGRPAPKHMLTNAEFLQFFADRGFKGRVFLWGMFGESVPVLPDVSYGFQVGVLDDPFRDSALSPCGCQSCSNNSRGHQCTPGPSARVSDALAEALRGY